MVNTVVTGAVRALCENAPWDTLNRGVFWQFTLPPGSFLIPPVSVASPVLGLFDSHFVDRSFCFFFVKG